jgi:hypothetical protein
MDLRFGNHVNIVLVAPLTFVVNVAATPWPWP